MLGHHINKKGMTSGFDVKRRRYKVILEEGVFKVLSDACIKAGLYAVHVCIYGTKAEKTSKFCSKLVNCEKSTLK